MKYSQILLYSGVVFIVGLVFTNAVADALDVKLENELVQAVQQRNIEKVSRMVGEGVDLRESSALTVAVEAGHIDIAKYLVEHGADPDGNKKGSAIAAAARTDNAEILNYLLSKGADINAESPSDESILSTPLIRAIYNGRLEEVRMLVQFGADVNKVNRKGNTALHQAIRFTNGNQTELVELLLKNGADPDMRDGYGATARQYAKSLPSNEIAALIDKTIPAAIANAPQPKYNYSLDTVSVEVIEQLLELRHGSVTQVSATPKIFYYDGMRPAFAECKYSKEYRRAVPELRLLIAICGNGPFGEGDLDETLSIVRVILNQIGVQGDNPELHDQYIKDYRLSKTKRSVSCLVPLVGHGIEFVPTSIIHDSESHTSLVVQVAVGDEEFYKLSRVHDLGIGLHEYLSGGQ